MVKLSSSNTNGVSVMYYDAMVIGTTMIWQVFTLFEIVWRVVSLTYHVSTWL